MNVAPPPRAAVPKRAALTALHLASLLALMSAWDLTHVFPGLLLWTCAALLLFLVTAAALGPGFTAGEGGRRRVWQPVAVCSGLVLGTFLLHASVPGVGVHGREVPTSVMVAAVDLVLALWLGARGALLVWDPAPGTLAVGAAAALLGAMALGWTWMVPMPGKVWTGPFVELDAEEARVRDGLEAHVRVLAGEIGERNHHRPEALEAAADYVAEVLNGLGHGVAEQRYDAFGRRFRNLEVTLPGRESPDEIVLVGAHYDTVLGAPGANDNASGVAALLELGRLLAVSAPGRTVRLVAFTNEEPPHFLTPSMGSAVYARVAAERGDRIVAMLSLETIGFYSDEPGSQRYPLPFRLFYPDRGDFIAFVGDLGSRRLVRRAVGTFRDTTPFPVHGVSAPAWLPGIGWSDQRSFWAHGYAGIMITDTAPFRYPHYHSAEDRPERLDYERMARVVRGVERVVAELARIDRPPLP